MEWVDWPVWLLRRLDPDQLKVRHFLDQTLSGAARTARQASKLKTDHEGLKAALVKNTARLGKMGDVLENLYETEGDVGRAVAFADISRSPRNSREQGEERQ